MKRCTEQDFLNDVAEHEMSVLLDNGLFRCVRFARKKDSWLNQFTLTTWPGYLCITGDMGCFVFTRLADMFEFFRTSPDKEKLYVNLGYWGEKCEAHDRRVGMEVYDEDVFKNTVAREFRQHEFRSRDQKHECWERIKDEVLNADNEHEAHEYARNFEHEGFEFSDFWEHDLSNYTYQYVWCCYAIAWGIRQYDKATTPQLIEGGK